MTFSYVSPPANDKDRVRFYSGDTVEKSYSVSDEDITFLLSELDGNVLEAAAVVADRIGDWWSTSVSAAGSDKKVGPFSVGQREGMDLAAAWRARAARLRMGTTSGLPTVSGASAIFTGDSVPEFSVGMQDNGFQAYPNRERGSAPINGVW